MPSALTFVHHSRFEPDVFGSSNDDALTLQEYLHILAGGRGQLLDLIQNWSFVFGAVRLIRDSERDVQQVVVRLRIATDKILVTQRLSDTKDLGELLPLVFLSE